MIAVALDARRRAPKRPTRPARPSGVRAVPPSGPMATYAAALLDLDAELRALITREVEAAGLAPTRTDAAADGDGPAPAETIKALLARLRKLAGDHLTLLRKPLALLKLVASRTSEHSAAQWSRQLRALGVSLDDVAGPDLRAAIAAWRRQNAQLIRSLVQEKVQRVARAIEEHRGSRVETLARRIQEATGTGEGHARLLARDQTLRLYGQVTQERHRAAGITEYVWRASRDERVRRRHRELDGTRQKYAEPPVVDEASGRRAHPGGDFQCRCTADPILPGIDDA